MIYCMFYVNIVYDVPRGYLFVHNGLNAIKVALKYPCDRVQGINLLIQLRNWRNFVYVME